MSNSEFENYVALIAKLLQLKREERDLIAGELQDHLQMRVADLTSEGMPKQDAVSKALEEFGDAAVMAKNFQTVLNLKRRRWMMRFATFSIAGVFTLAIFLMAMWPNQARFGAPDRSVAQESNPFGEVQGTGGDPFASEPKAEPRVKRTGSLSASALTAAERDLKAERALDKSISLQYDETPVQEIIEELSGVTGLNFLFHSSALDDGLPKDEPISVSLVDIPLATGLEMMLASKNATYVINCGVIMIISRDDAEDPRFQRIKMFDCKKLVAQLPKISTGFAFQGGGIGGPVNGGSAGGGGLFSVQASQVAAQGASQGATPQNDPAATPVVNVEAMVLAKAEALLAKQRELLVAQKSKESADPTLLNIVFDMVDPESWVNMGGYANAEVVNGVLIVRQSEKGLRDVERLIIDLREKMLKP